MARVNPYTTLKEDFREFIDKCLCRHRVSMFRYAKATVLDGCTWKLNDLAERVQAAQQLGYTVEVKWTDDGLVVEYVKKLPDAPWWY